MSSLPTLIESSADAQIWPLLPDAEIDRARPYGRVRRAVLGEILAVPWDTQFKSILELAEACDGPARWPCRTGVCHICECGILDGGSCTHRSHSIHQPRATF